MFLCFLWLSTSVFAEERPNIVLILADDLGYSDLGCYGSEISTPNLDKLAAGGVRFTQFYNCARCCPTRASLLTGLYPHQAGVGHMTFDRGEEHPGYRGQLQKNCVTLAEVLKESGYQTAMVGKWHVSLTKENPNHLKNLNNQIVRETFADIETYPTRRGFEKFYGIIWGVVNYFDPFSLVDGEQAVKSVPDGFYLTDALTDRAVQYIGEMSNSEKPFFLYLAYNAPHWPVHTLPEEYQKYENTYTAGWDSIRNARYERQKKLGIIDAKTELSPRLHNNRKWEDNIERKLGAQLMACHAAVVDRMDQGIGRVLEKLKQSGADKNTLILFLSDNGASPETPQGGGFDRVTETRRGEPVLYRKALFEKGITPGTETTYPAIGEMWANVANTPLRFAKASNYEGGICTPLIAHWTDRIVLPKGSITHQPRHVVDIMATVLDAAGAKYPQTYRGEKITPYEGSSLLKVFRNETVPEREFGWEHEGNRAFREGDWKIISSRNRPWELYNLSVDRTELYNAAEANPEVFQRLQKKWAAWAERTNVEK